MPGRMEFQLNLPKSAPTPSRRDSDAPPRFLIMADFSGRGSRETPAARPDLASRPLLAMDADRFNAVMARLEPALRLPLAAGADLTVRFAQLDDFHPDALYQRLDLFQALRRSRTRLLDPASFAQAAAELAPSTPPEPAHSESPAPAENAVHSSAPAPAQSDSRGRPDRGWDPRAAPLHCQLPDVQSCLP